MEQNLQLQVEPIPKSIRVRQDIAAWLFVLSNAYMIIAAFIPMAPFVNNAITSIICITGWSILTTIASNKATRVAALLSILFSIATCIRGMFQIPFTWVTTTMLIIPMNLIWIYIYSLIIQANDIDNKDKVWISLLVVFQIMNTTSDLNFMIGQSMNLDSSHVWAWNLFLVLPFHIIFGGINIIAGYRLAKCSAFSGNYNPSHQPKEIYSPVNKYFAALLITTSILCGLWVILYSCIDFIESI